MPPPSTTPAELKSALEKLNSLPRLKQLRKIGGPWLSDRVSAADALALDDEISALLQSQVDRAWFFSAPSSRQSWEPETSALLSTVLWCLYTGINSPTPGLRLQGLRLVPDGSGRSRMSPFGSGYHDNNNNNNKSVGQNTLSSTTRSFSFIATVLLPYVLKKLSASSWATNRLPPTLLEGIQAGAGLTTAVLHLSTGKGRALWEALSSTVVAPRAPWGIGARARRVSFEVLNRQLVWAGFADFALFILPLLTAPATSRLMRRITSMMTSWSSSSSSSSSGNSGSGRGGNVPNPLIPQDTCPVCRSSPPWTPVTTQCNCQYCYHCAANTAAAALDCSRCGSEQGPSTAKR